MRCGVSQASERYAPQKIATHGRTTWRGPNLSRRMPKTGEAPATVSAAMLNPAETASRCQPKETDSGFRKSPKVYGTTAAKLPMTPKNPASTTFHPGLAKLNSGRIVVVDIK